MQLKEGSKTTLENTAKYINTLANNLEDKLGKREDLKDEYKDFRNTLDDTHEALISAITHIDNNTTKSIDLGSLVSKLNNADFEAAVFELDHFENDTKAMATLNELENHISNTLGCIVVKVTATSKTKD